MNHSNQKAIPDEIKRFNWGAFFLSWIWAIRFGIWVGLIAIIPIVGFFMRFVLGFKGNEWAWKKNNFSDSSSFLKAQRSWAIAGWVIFITVSILFLSLWYQSNAILSYILDRNSLGQERATNILAHNHRVADILGKDLTIQSGWSEDRSLSLNAPLDAYAIWGVDETNFSESAFIMEYEIHGTKASGIVRMVMEKIYDHWVTRYLSISPSKNSNIEKSRLIDLGITSTVKITGDETIENILKAIQTQNSGDFLLINRSAVLNDFMQTAIAADQNTAAPCFFIEYSNGYNHVTKRGLFQTKQCYTDITSIANIFHSYLTGNDEFMDLDVWHEITPIDSND